MLLVKERIIPGGETRLRKCYGFLVKFSVRIFKRQWEREVGYTREGLINS